MRILRILTLATVAAMVCATGFAGHYSDLYVIPAASHTPGQNGTMWMSDLAFHNFQSTPLDIQIIVIESGFNPDNVVPLMTPEIAGAVTVPARGSVLLKDVLDGHAGMSSTIGALLVGADRPFAVTSRSYSMSPAGDTVGQTVTPSASFLDNTLSPIDLASAVAYLPGLIQNNEFRTNLGMVAANASGSGAPMVVTITIRRADGAVAGTRDFIVNAGQVMQMHMSARGVAQANFDIAAAEVRITSGSGAVAPYASVIDNRTADAVYIAGRLPRNTTSAALATSATTSVFRSLYERTREKQRR